MITVIDDWLSGQDLASIINVCGDESYSSWQNFPLYFTPTVATPDDQPFNGYFTHQFYTDGNSNSDFSWIVDDILLPRYLKLSKDIINDKIRPIDVKYNFFTRTETEQTFGFHTDNFCVDHNSLILYLNDCEGYTLFDDGSRVRQKRNRVVIVTEGLKYRHASTSTTDTKMRANINMVLFDE